MEGVLGQPANAVTAAFNAEGGERGYDLVVDYLWGRPTEIFLGAIDRGDAHLGSGRVRLLQAGEMTGSSISLPGSVLRSAGLEVLGLGTGTMPPPDVITRTLGNCWTCFPAGSSTLTSSGCRYQLPARCGHATSKAAARSSSRKARQQPAQCGDLIGRFCTQLAPDDLAGWLLDEVPVPARNGPWLSSASTQSCSPRWPYRSTLVRRPEVGGVVGEHGGFGAAVDLDDLAGDVARCG